MDVLRRVLPALAVAAVGAASVLGAGAAVAAPTYSYDVPLDPASPWPKFLRTSTQVARSPLKPTATSGHLWTTHTGVGIFSSPVIGGDGTVYVGSGDRRFYAISRAGKVRWSHRTGEIIDSAALLDDEHHAIVGSADGSVYAFDRATGKVAWRFDAESQAATGGLINWFEGNIAIGPDGTLYAPNDNHRTYAFDRHTRAVKWAWETSDQTWSLPAVNAATGRVFLGNNFFFGGTRNTFALDAADGTPVWQKSADGPVVASPLLTADGMVVVGAWDGYVRAYDQATGEERWAFGTRDHLYASPTQEADGTIVQASTDGSVYGIDPRSGKQVWRFDTTDPIRSSPAIDGAGNIYVGGGDGRLIVLDGRGRLRWAMRIAAPPRGTLNSSPALGPDAVAIGDSNGDIHNIPYEYCLRGRGRTDRRCERGTRAPGNGVSLVSISPFGLSQRAPSTISANQPLAFQLRVRKSGQTQTALIDTTGVKLTVSPRSAARIAVSGDRRYVTVVPAPAGYRSGRLRLTISGRYLTGLQRAGLIFTGGHRAGAFRRTVALKVRPRAAASAWPLPVPKQVEDPAGVYRLHRFALPLPTLLPSYNQIGFERLEFQVGMVEGHGDTAIAWMVGSKLVGDGSRIETDPDARWMVPFVVRKDHGLLTFTNAQGTTVELNGFQNNVDRWQISARVDPRGRALETTGTALTVNCGGIGVYGAALQQLGACASGRPMTIFGGADLSPNPGASVQTDPGGIGALQVAREGDRLVARLAGSKIDPSAKNIGLLVIDAATGVPLPLDYSYGTQRTADADGHLTSVSVPLTGSLPASVRAYVMLGAFPATMATVPLAP